MKIEGSLGALQTPLTSRQKNQLPSKDTDKTRGGGETVQLSGAASHLRPQESDPIINKARVSEIRQAIAEGRFKINPEAIADSIISTAKELVASQRRA